MKKLLSILCFLSVGTVTYGQEFPDREITIEECYRWAYENYPMVRQYGLLNLSEEYSLKNASKAYLPQFSISGKATYQTDVTSIPISIPGYDIPTLSKDQYQVLAELSQVLWDGGVTKANRENIRAQGDVDRAQYEVDMYAVRSRVNDLYFGILLLDEQLRLNSLFLEDLRLNHDRVSSYMANGIANQSDLDAITVEQLSARQNHVQFESNRTAYLTMLSAFTGRPLNENTILRKPDDFSQDPAVRGQHRPEMDLFSAMSRQMESKRRALRASNMPHLGVFIQGGYGKPGLNMLEDKFKTFAIGGFRLSWNFSGFYTRRNDLRKIDIGIDKIGIQRETFLFNTNLQQSQLDAEYSKYRKMMEDDDDIIRMRKNILEASEVKLENGIISVTDLMRDMISEQNAKVNKAVHEIELLQTVYGIKNLTNN